MANRENEPDRPTRGQNEQDRKEHLHELADQFGQGVGNAEALINANSASRSGDLATISSLPLLMKETEELDLDSLEGPDGEMVLDAAVRGSGRTQGTVVVYEIEDSEGKGTGRIGKHLADMSQGKSKSGPRRSSHLGERGDAKVSDASAKAGPGPAKS